MRPYTAIISSVPRLDIFALHAAGITVARYEADPKLSTSDQARWLKAAILNEKQGDPRGFATAFAIMPMQPKSLISRANEFHWRL